MSRSDEIGAVFKFVMPGLGPGIHVVFSETTQDLDGRDKPAMTLQNLRGILNDPR
jgi:hypothetical protein